MYCTKTNLHSPNPTGVICPLTPEGGQGREKDLDFNISPLFRWWPLKGSKKSKSVIIDPNPYLWVHHSIAAVDRRVWLHYAFRPAGHNRLEAIGLGPESVMLHLPYIAAW